MKILLAIVFATFTAFATIPNLDPAAGLSPMTNCVWTNEVNLFWDPSPSTNISGYYIYDGTNSANYNEVWDAADETNYVLETTNQLPLYITAACYDTNFASVGQPANVPPWEYPYVPLVTNYETSLLSAELYFDGWLYYDFTNYIHIHNPSTNPVLYGPSPQTPVTERQTTNFTDLWLTNATGNIFFFGYGLIATGFSTHLTKPAP